MIRIIDDFLNSFTMYKVVLYGLLVLVGISILFSFAGILTFTAVSMITSLVVLILTSFVVNFLFSKLFKAPVNSESFVITSLILFLILTPPPTLSQTIPLILAASIAMASKYIFAFKKHHFLNPAAAGAFAIGLFGSPAAEWWVATPILLPFTLLVGLLIVRKIRKFSLFLAFIVSATFLITLQGLLFGQNILDVISEIFVSWPLVFFGTVMLTEPLTMPSKRILQILYGVVVGVLFSLQFQIGPLYSTPELSLLLGNIYSFIISPKQKLILKLKDKMKVSAHVYDFIFTPSTKLAFEPGQYLEWTLPGAKADSRGNRRYFTIASSPTEDEIRLGMRVSEDGSSFKKKLLSMDENDTISVGNLSGDFVLPENKDQKLVFIAGGIGVTPFRSMVQFLIDTTQKRDIVLFYAVSNPADFLYKEIFERAEKEIGLQTVYIITDRKEAPHDWKGETGYITPSMIQEKVPDYKDRVFYLSGPQGMVDNYKKLLKKLAIPYSNIMTDYFPGL